MGVKPRRVALLWDKSEGDETLNKVNLPNGKKAYEVQQKLYICIIT